MAVELNQKPSVCIFLTHSRMMDSSSVTATAQTLALENAGYLLAMKRSQATKLKKAVERMLIKEDYRFYQTQVSLLRGWSKKLVREMTTVLAFLVAA